MDGIGSFLFIINVFPPHYPEYVFIFVSKSDSYIQMNTIRKQHGKINIEYYNFKNLTGLAMKLISNNVSVCVDMGDAHIV